MISAKEAKASSANTLPSRASFPNNMERPYLSWQLYCVSLQTSVLQIQMEHLHIPYTGSLYILIDRSTEYENTPCLLESRTIETSSAKDLS